MKNPPRAGEYKVVVVDPPWDQGMVGKTAHHVRASDLAYDTLDQQGILDTVPLHEWAASESCLWLWTTNSRSKSSGKPIIQSGFELMEAWGYRYYTMITWSKQTGVCPFGPYQITTESILFGFRGKMPKVPMGKLQTCFTETGKGHSIKPASFYEGIRGIFPGPRLDVFARGAHDGFDGWGNEYELNFLE